MPNGSFNGHFNGPANGHAPGLPKMTVAERQLWAASKQLPAGILLIYEEEMQQLASNALAVTQRAENAEMAAGLARQQLELCRESGAKLKQTLQSQQRLIDQLNRKIQ